MPVIITITNQPINIDGSNEVCNYDKYDRILRNINKNEYEVFYSGQNKGQMDYQLIDAITNNDTFKVYYRPRKSMNFTYLGYTNNVNVVQYRTLPLNIRSNSNERLQIHLTINNISNTPVPINDFIGSGRYKKDILVHLLFVQIVPLVNDPDNIQICKNS